MGVKNKRVCSLHFGATDYIVIGAGGRRILGTALPSFNIPPSPSHQIDLVVCRRTAQSTFYVNVNGSILCVRHDQILVQVGKSDPTPNGAVLMAITKTVGNPPVAVTTGNEMQVVNNNDEAEEQLLPQERKRRKLEQRVKKLATDVSYFRNRSAKNRNGKSNLRILLMGRISKNRVKNNDDCQLTVGFSFGFCDLYPK